MFGFCACVILFQMRHYQLKQTVWKVHTTIVLCSSIKLQRETVVAHHYRFIFTNAPQNHKINSWRRHQQLLGLVLVDQTSLPLGLLVRVNLSAREVQHHASCLSIILSLAKLTEWKLLLCRLLWVENRPTEPQWSREEQVDITTSAMTELMRKSNVATTLTGERWIEVCQRRHAVKEVARLTTIVDQVKWINYLRTQADVTISVSIRSLSQLYMSAQLLCRLD